MYITCLAHCLLYTKLPMNTINYCCIYLLIKKPFIDPFPVSGTGLGAKRFNG